MQGTQFNKLTLWLVRWSRSTKIRRTLIWLIDRNFFFCCAKFQFRCFLKAKCYFNTNLIPPAIRFFDKNCTQVKYLNLTISSQIHRITKYLSSRTRGFLMTSVSRKLRLVAWDCTEKWSWSFWISSVNVTKSAVFCGFSHIYHGTLTQTGITCRKTLRYMRDSACRWFIVTKAKTFWSYIKRFWILTGVRKCRILIESPNHIFRLT